MSAKGFRNIDIENSRTIDNGKPLVFIGARNLNTSSETPEWKHDDNTWIVVDSKKQAEDLIKILKKTFKLEEQG